MSIGTLNLIHERESVPFERERGYSMMNVEINQSLVYTACFNTAMLSSSQVEHQSNMA